MNEWLKKVLDKAKDLWSKWKPVQKVILIGIVVVVIVVIVAAARLSAKPSSVRLFNNAVTDETVRLNILDRLDRENVSAYTDDSGFIYVPDAATKRRMLAILNDENLVPSNQDIWADYFNRGWSTTDADQNVKLQVKRQLELKKFLESYSDITSADVQITLPADKLFLSEQTPVKASVILRASPSLLTDKNRILGIQRAVLGAVDKLTAENLVITDSDGNQINDFEGMAAFDRLSLVEKGEKIKQKREVEIRAKILKLFQYTYTEDRCRDMVVAVEMDLSEKTSNSTEYSPIVIKPDNPDTPYDDSEYRDSIPVSEQTVEKKWQGTGYNPEGPAGVEGQTPPVYSDMSNVIGTSEEKGITRNNLVNTKETSQVTAPQIDKVSVSVNLDGRWKLVKDSKGNPVIDEDGSLKRIYTPLTQEEISEAERSIRGAIGFNRERGDLVVVTNIAYDRDEEHRAEDEAYYAAIQRRRTILLILISVAVILVSFIVFRVISRELERRRREKEEEMLRRQQAERERALWDAKDEGMEVTMSVEETRRMELQENAIAMAKEHPEDVAMLIRTWLMEE